MIRILRTKFSESPVEAIYEWLNGVTKRRRVHGKVKYMGGPFCETRLLWSSVGDLVAMATTFPDSGGIETPDEGITSCDRITVMTEIE